MAKKHEGSLTAREAALLIVSEELGCVLPSSNIVQHMKDDLFFVVHCNVILISSFRRDPSELEPPPPAREW